MRFLTGFYHETPRHGIRFKIKYHFDQGGNMVPKRCFELNHEDSMNQYCQCCFLGVSHAASSGKSYVRPEVIFDFKISEYFRHYFNLTNLSYKFFI